ncbi:hypothetical protein NGB78_02825 [Staphylococcus arlettae]|uniref:hypothetical protein n=1 Tax=Staphylococcus arlettae TaxID=29378 RepID=UPI001E379505|nr:hypothetical protein [Staphylococcus arlettae]MCD8838310.1 hypothetical protein [Staphylococcus arlettae]MCD8848590.1 hypothetical protein [Staphylococcus arlettae]MCD8865517.1 hypothetical protein [Staphylococcus arlettae]MEB7421039.1 hypothetical protein [Staphylococcus arlettae]
MFLVNYESKFLPYIMSYQLTYDQIHFPKTPSVHINNAQYNSDMNCILGFNDDNNLVTFFVLQQASEYAKYFTSTKNATIFLKAFSTDARFLQNGYAKSCLLLLDDFIKTHYPHVQFIALVVNEDNVISYNLYNSVGFYNTGQTILKYGVKQQLLQKTINL